MHLDQLAVLSLRWCPLQVAHRFVGLAAAAVIELAVALKREVKELARGMDVLHQFLGGALGRVIKCCPCDDEGRIDYGMGGRDGA